MEDFKLKRKIMQLLIAGFPESSVNISSGIRKHLNNGLGGVFLTNTARQGKTKKCNIVNPKQLKHLCADLQLNSAKPLFIAMDAQGGARSPFNKSFDKSCFPNFAAALGQGDVFETYNQSASLTDQLNSFGVNLNLGNSIALQNGFNKEDDMYRFSANPDDLIQHVTSHLKGQLYNSNTLSVSLKDFPANKYDFAKQLNILKELVNDKHLTISAIELNHSSYIDFDLNFLINTILREKTGFDGLLIAQDFETSELSESMSLSNYVIKGLNAGVNMFIISNNNECSVTKIDQLVEDLIYAVYSDKLSEETIDKSLLRINAIKTLKLKNKQNIAA